MQLGTRWSFGTTPPATLPEAVLEGIISVEAELTGHETAPTWRWTLTYLENRPIAQLDDGTTIRYNPSTNEATTTSE